MTDVLVAGVEIGSSSLSIATVNKHGLQIVLNKESGRETPCVVSFGRDRRYCGTEASAHASTNLTNTVAEVTKLLGRSVDDPQLQQWLKTRSFEVRHLTKRFLFFLRCSSSRQVVPTKTASGMNAPAVRVTYQGKSLLQQPEQLLAALLTDAKHLAEQGAASPVQLLALACPVHFTNAQRLVRGCLPMLTSVMTTSNIDPHRA